MALVVSDLKWVLIGVSLVVIVHGALRPVLRKPWSGRWARTVPIMAKSVGPPALVGGRYVDDRALATGGQHVGRGVLRRYRSSG